MSTWLTKANDAVYVVTSILAVGFIWIVSFGLFERAGAAGGTWILAFTLVPFVCVLVHELGHAAFALLGGWRVVEIHVAPLLWRPNSGGLRWVGVRPRQDYAGYCAVAPGPNATRAGYILGVLAGPLASIALAIVAALVAIEFVDVSASPVGTLGPAQFSDDGLVRMRLEDAPPESWRQAITPLFASMSAQSAFAALFSLWPAQPRGILNDGALILEALRRNPLYAR